MHKIYWLKWKDPLAHLVHEFKQEEDDDIEHEASQDTFIGPDTPHYQKNGSSHGNTGPAIIGPNGIIPIHESNLPGVLFNFWMGHTNFNLSKDIVKKLKEVPGVESLDIFSRYRFRISVGKAFQQKRVMKAIEKAICFEQVKPKEVAKPDKFDNMRAIANGRFPFWAIVVLKNGHVRIAGGKSKEEVENKVGGLSDNKRVIYSWQKDAQ